MSWLNLKQKNLEINWDFWTRPSSSEKPNRQTRSAKIWCDSENWVQFGISKILNFVLLTRKNVVQDQRSIYSGSLKIDTPKIDTFYENSRNFQKSKNFGKVLSKSLIFGQNPQFLVKIIKIMVLTFDWPQTALERLSKGSRNLKIPIFRPKNIGKISQKLVCQRLTRQRLTHFQCLSTHKVCQSLANHCICCMKQFIIKNNKKSLVFT